MSQSHSPGQITIDVAGTVLLIGIERVSKRNAFGLAMLDQLAAAYDQLNDSADLRAGVLYAEGDHFSAGLDLAEVGPAVMAEGPQRLAGRGNVDPFGVWKPPVSKPIVMAVQGIALTLSIELALAADIVVAAADVRFRQLEVGRGIMPYGGASFRAPTRLNWGNAMRFLLTAEEFGASEALRIGLVQEVVPTGEQVSRATAIARTISEQAPLGVQATLENARVMEDRGPSAAVEHLRETVRPLFESKDAAEGIRSFAERRPGRYRGR